MHAVYFKDGKLIIAAAKLIDLHNYIKIFRGYFTKYIHASTLFLFSTSIFCLKANERLKYNISKYFFLSFFDAMYICISLNYAVIKQVLSSKQCISFFLFIKMME